MFCHLSVAQCPLPIPLPFPSIFGASVGQQGELLSSPITGSSSRGSLDVHSIPLAARLRSSSSVLPFLENRMGKLHRYGIERGAPGAQLLRSWGFGQDELEDMGEMMSKMVVQLKPDSGMSSDSDWVINPISLFCHFPSMLSICIYRRWQASYNIVQRLDWVNSDVFHLKWEGIDFYHPISSYQIYPLMYLQIWNAPLFSICSCRCRFHCIHYCCRGH